MASSHSCEFFSDEEAKSLTSLYNKGGLAAVIPVIKDKLHNLENETLNIAVTGCTGSGKSAFINALRGLRRNDEGAAPVDVVEKTMEAKAYKHPNLPGVNLWDLPGTGSPAFQAKDYLKKVDFNRYDFFVIMAAKRFTENDANLAVEIEKMGKQFYFIRNQIDNDIRSYELEGIEYNREEVLQTIRNDCIAKLKQIGIKKPRVFLLSNYHVNEYDFTAFTQTIEAELPEKKQHVFWLSLPSFTLQVIEKKKQILKKRIWMIAAGAGGVGAIPVPGLSIACDIAILVAALLHYREFLGLDPQSLQRLALNVGKPLEVLEAEVQNPFVFDITPQSVTKLLTSSVFGALMIADDALLVIPVIGSILGGITSFGTTYMMLSNSLDQFVDSTQRVVKKALE